ncbi:Copper resistance protein CopC [Sphingobium herbicidovorans NBRC 16415]|uniref:Copper resistance protein CopC n=1 Tax=Sphingobium herbicidovorans (strain ATCC 700291 / DSM 11019 / CCUG 56400 / KCTC 2939 / LMG 18315 / NBRC 16415 / MH) TaxID=1219045 RepID=A0A086PFD8_SPHHM|nr:copper homeostasis periplasmic binding protein CopC [Sphingobium herbicidovorans]KFG92106.1 Copper resistance protein CopC [Sphingobium herbicidovorans NBRC 16415]
MRRILFTAAIALAALPSVAMAHPKLLSSTPAANATVAKPTRLTLTFSEKLLAPTSGVDLTMTGMPGMANHAPMPIKGFKTAVEGDGKTLAVTLPRALPAGSYDLNWHVVSADQHKITGKYSFSVK